MRSCIVFQGPLYNHCIEILCNMIKAAPNNCIVSTWNTEDPVLIKQLWDAGAIEVIQSVKPAHAGGQNLNYMTFSTSVGINKAEELGFTHVLRFRTDYALSDLNKFIGICESMDPDKLIFMCWYNVIYHQYLIDYFTFGPIHLMRMYYAARRPLGDDAFNPENCNEKLLQETYFKKIPVSFEDTHSKCDFIIKRAIDEGVELYCIKFSLNTNDKFKEFIDSASYVLQ